MMVPRYAVYYAPPEESLISQRAAAWLGRDAFTGARVHRPILPGLVGLNLDALTRDPRGYGFHATLKAPFELAEAATEKELLDFAAAFAARRGPFEATIEPTRLSSFLAFRLLDPSPEMDALHADCVTEFDRFRAPLSEFDLERRRKSPLTPEQDARLLKWGYPYVFEDFRFHMTLTGKIRDQRTGERLLVALRSYFAQVCGPHLFDGVTVFKQDGRTAPFRILSRFEFQAVRGRKAAAG